MSHPIPRPRPIIIVGAFNTRRKYNNYWELTSHLRSQYILKTHLQNAKLQCTCVKLCWMWGCGTYSGTECSQLLQTGRCRHRGTQLNTECKVFRTVDLKEFSTVTCQERLWPYLQASIHRKISTQKQTR